MQRGIRANRQIVMCVNDNRPEEIRGDVTLVAINRRQSGCPLVNCVASACDFDQPARDGRALSGIPLTWMCGIRSDDLQTCDNLSEFSRTRERSTVTLSMIATYSLINCNNPQLSPLNRVVTVN